MFRVMFMSGARKSFILLYNYRVVYRTEIQVLNCPDHSFHVFLFPETIAVFNNT